MSTEPQHLRRALRWLGGGVLASAVVQYLLLFAVARWLGVADYGVFSLALTVAVLAAPLCDLGTAVSVVYVGSQRPLELLPQFGGALLLRLVTCVPVGLGALAVGLACGYGESFATLFVPLFVAALADGVGNLCSGACQAQDRVATSSLLQVGRNLLRGAALVVALSLGGGPFELALLFAGASLLGGLPAILCVTRGRLPRLQAAWLWPTVKAALPFGAGVLATLLHAQIGIAVLGAMAGEEEVGRFHAGARFVLLLQLVPQVVAVATAPYSYRTALDGIDHSARLYRVKLTALATLGLLATLLLATAGVPLVHWCLGPKFHGTEALLVAMAPLVFVKFLSSVLGDTLSAIGRQDRLGLGCWLALAVNVATSLVLVREHGAAGAVFAMLASESFLLVWVATMLVVAGLDLAWTQTLRHPLAIAVAAGLASWLLPAVFVFPVALAVTVAVLAWRPTAEERLLLGRGAGGRA